MCPEPWARRKGSAAWVIQMAPQQIGLQLIAQVRPVGELLESAEVAVARRC